VFGLLHNLQISVTPVNVHGHVDPEISATATDWLSAVDSPDKEKESPAVGEQEDAAAQENEASSAT
jgi:5'-nucleotidase